MKNVHDTMKRYVLLLCLLGLLVALGCTPQQPVQSRQEPVASPRVQPQVAKSPSTQVAQTTPEAYAMDIKNFAFSQPAMTINKGDTITWTNKDSAPHTVTSDAGNELGSGNLAQRQSYSHTFSRAGTFSYHCAVHPSMTATVVVK